MNLPDCFAAADENAGIPVIPVNQSIYTEWLAGQSQGMRNWLEANAFEPTAQQICVVPSSQGQVKSVIVGVDTPDDPWAFAGLPIRIPAGQYRIQANYTSGQFNNAAIGWGLGSYRYTRYRSNGKGMPQLLLAPSVDEDLVCNQVHALWMVRDLINTPAADMMPLHLSKAAAKLAEANGCKLQSIIGDDLLAQNFPTIHAVGRASVHLPRLIEFTWGEAKHPKVTLIGKGVCFDSGGLDLKPASGMRLMKKDMGGAAHVLGLAQMIMGAKLPIRLRVLVPAVENAVSGNAFRPGDVIMTRKKISVEIDNTDAEGRLVLCDAITEACREKPELIMDFATLTGAARVALGKEIPAFFCNSQVVATKLMQAAEAAREAIWCMPLHREYRYLLDSRIADISNSSSEPYGGAITAALFLQEFIEPGVEWVHFDIMAWNTRDRPGRPTGGEAMGLRAAFAYLYDRYRPAGE